MRVSAPVKAYIKDAIYKKTESQRELVKSQVKEREDRNNKAKYFIIQKYKELLGKVMEETVKELSSMAPEGTKLDTIEWNKDKKAMPISDRLISDAARAADFCLEDPILVEQQNKVKYTDRLRLDIFNQIVAELELGKLKLTDLDTRLDNVSILEEDKAA